MAAVTTLPTFTKRIDDAFTETWYEIRAEAIDNILNATPLWAALKAKGCLTPQVGGDTITRTIQYGTAATPIDIVKGDTLSQGEPQLETVARWTFRNMSTHVQRDLLTDRENRGKFKIKDYVAKRLKAARDSMVQQYEAELVPIATAVAETTSKAIQGLNEMIPDYTYANAGTSPAYGGIARPATLAADGNVYRFTQAGSTGSNWWWGSVYKALTLPIEVNLVSDMKSLYNGISNNMEPPDLILSSQSLFEAYEDFGLDMAQVVKDDGGQLLDLGFDVMRYKGKPWVWSNGLTFTGSKAQMLMLNTKYIELVYDPGMWFDMTEWKTPPFQTTRVAHILSTCNLISTQLRRHGRLYEA